jgi:ketosteroid isomerase-like protein
MAREDIDRVRDGYDAFNRRDIDGILALLAEDIEYRMPLDPLGVHPIFRGHDGVRAFYETIWDGFEEFRIEIESIRELPGDVLVISGHVVARPRSGSVTTFRISHFWKTAGGRAVAVAFHDAMNPLALLENGPRATAAEEGG